MSQIYLDMIIVLNILLPPSPRYKGVGGAIVLKTETYKELPSIED
jgi:hypothetical protein